MKKLRNILLIVSIAFLCTNCETSQNVLVKKVPFTIKSASYKYLTGDTPRISSISIKIETTNIIYKLDSVYFRNNKVALKKNKSTYLGVIVHSNNRNQQIYSNNPKKEYGNKVPDVSLKIPFKLKKDEAVVTFLMKKKRKYYKIENLVEITPLKIP